MGSNLLEISHLSISFTDNNNRMNVVRDVSLKIERGEIFGLVGESGSGKSITALTIAGLLKNNGRTSIKGTMAFAGNEISLNRRRSQDEHHKINMIFQDPFDSLNPAFTIGDQVREVYRVKKKLDKRTASAKTIEILEMVNIAAARNVAKLYPHQLSGGMCQRVMIAIALAAEPELLIADEPTTALDVTIQAQIMRLLIHLHRATQTSILFITHDLGLVAQVCQKVAIMSEGRIVEKGPVRNIFKNPQHPYTKGLIGSIPVLGKKERLKPMPQLDFDQNEAQCGFYQRCDERYQLCEQKTPEFIEVEPGHHVLCHRGMRDGCDA